MKGKQKKKGGNPSNSLNDRKKAQLIRNMTKDEIREQLKHLNLKTTGKRNELVRKCRNVMLSLVSHGSCSPAAGYQAE